MVRRFICLLGLFLFLSISCRPVPHSDRLFTDFCFSQKYADIGFEPVLSNTYDNCKYYPRIFVDREFPVRVVSQGWLIDHVEAMVKEINTEVGQQILVVRSAEIFEDVSMFNGDMFLYPRYSGTCLSSEKCLGSTKFFRSDKRLKIHIEILLHKIHTDNELKAVIKHELGHGLGLAHDNSSTEFLMHYQTNRYDPPRPFSKKDIKVLRDLVK